MAPHPQTTPVARVELRRASVLDVVASDDVLRACALLRSLSREVQQALLEQGTPRRFADQAGVFQQGEAGSGLFLVLKGEARLEVQDGSLVVTVVPESLSVPPLVRSAAARLLGLTYTLPDLPLGFQARSVAVGEDGVTVTAVAEDVVLGPVDAAS